MDLVRPMLLSSLLVAAGCDPFAPAEPQTPTVAGSVQAATSPVAVPPLFARGLKTENVLQSVALVGDGFQGVAGGTSFGRAELLACVERLAKQGVDSASFAWVGTPSGVTDSVSGDVDWTLRRAGGGSFGGRAAWAVVRDESAEWRLERWSETSASGGWSDACGGF